MTEDQMRTRSVLARGFESQARHCEMQAARASVEMFENWGVYVAERCEIAALFRAAAVHYRGDTTDRSAIEALRDKGLA